MAIGYIWAIILGVGILFLPESPRWDIRKGYHERARVTMTKFYGVSLNHRVVDRETKEINHALDASSGDHPWYEALTGPRMMYRVLLGMGLQMFQQLTGANYFFYYGTTVFAGVGISNSYVTAMILGGVNFGCTFLGLYMVEKFGRRKCLYWGAVWQFVCFMVFASIGHFKFNKEPANSSDAKTAGYVMIVSLPPVSFASFPFPKNCKLTREKLGIRMSLYRFVRIDMGSYGLGRYRRNVPLPLPCSRHGPCRLLQLVLELHAGFFHALYRRRY